MFIGPVFNREVVIAPRRPRLYLTRTSYGVALLVIMLTAWLVVTGTQVVTNVGDLARFGTLLFQLLAPLQLGLALFFAALMAGSAVAQEKDRGTLILLLLTRLTNSELVLGKLLAGMLNVLVMLVASVPLFMLGSLLGGISFAQVAVAMTITFTSALAAGSLGSTLGLWREKTFQTLALTLLTLVFWLALGEAIGLGVFGETLAGTSAENWAVAMSPLRAIRAATQPTLEHQHAFPIIGAAENLYLAFSLAITAVLNLIGIVMVRVWNPSREARARQEDDGPTESIWGAEYDAQTTAAASTVAAAVSARSSVHAAPGRKREPWDNPILWREIRTWAYGRKVLVIRFAYLLLAGFAAAALFGMAHSEAGIRHLPGGMIFVGLSLLSLILVNAQAVTSLTSERDGGALDLLLVTDLTAKEFVFGKLGGVFFNSKEMVLAPLLLCGYLWWLEEIDTENLLCLAGGLLVLFGFVAMLGVHSGMNYTNSRSAIGVSLGTVFFLFVGIATCMWMMIAFSGSFSAQLAPFATFIAGGTLGLYIALGARNRSQAIFLAALLLPIATFYAITTYLMQSMMAVFLVTVCTYAFTTAAMLVPGIYEFDVATGRTTSGDE